MTTSLGHVFITLEFYVFTESSLFPVTQSDQRERQRPFRAVARTGSRATPWSGAFETTIQLPCWSPSLVQARFGRHEERELLSP